MVGYNLPPGCRVSDIPGNNPIDKLWDEYWDSDIPEQIWCKMMKINKFLGSDLYKMYEIENEYKLKIDQDFNTRYTLQEVNDGLSIL